MSSVRKSYEGQFGSPKTGKKSRAVAIPTSARREGASGYPNLKKSPRGKAILEEAVTFSKEHGLPRATRQGVSWGSEHPDFSFPLRLLSAWVSPLAEPNGKPEDKEPTEFQSSTSWSSVEKGASRLGKTKGRHAAYPATRCIKHVVYTTECCPARKRVNKSSLCQHG